jgi:hypothetical protein
MVRRSAGWAGDSPAFFAKAPRGRADFATVLADDVFIKKLTALMVKETNIPSFVR